MKQVRLSFLLSIIGATTALAIIDTNDNGVSDFWERNYNSGNLFSTFEPQSDPDGDGWTNGQEATTGTNPFDANPPTGFICPNVIHSNAVYGDLDEDGIDEIITPEAVTIDWPTLAGKEYTLLASLDLTTEGWFSVDLPRIGNGAPMGNGIPLTQPDGSKPDKLFWRVRVEDADSDGDNLTNAEENNLGTNAYASDTDSDGVDDFEEHTSGTSPTVPRIWAFIEIRNTDQTVTFTWNSFAENGDLFEIEEKQSNGTWKRVYSTTYGGLKLPYNPASNAYSLTLNPVTDYTP